MSFILSMLCIFMAFFSIQPSEADLTTTSQNVHLWQQIGPKITNSANNPNQSARSTLRLCTASSLSSYGNKHAAIDQEFMQTIDSLHLLSQVMPRIAHYNLQHGYFGFAKNICQLSGNMQELQRRQEVIVYLQEHKDFVSQVDELLCSLQPTEVDYLRTLYPKNHFLGNDILQKPLITQINNFYLTFRKRIESNRILSEWWQRTKIAGVIGACYLTASYIYKDSKAKNSCKATTISSWSNYIEPITGEGRAVTIVSSPGIVHALTASTFIMSLANVINMSYALKQDFDDVYRKQQSLLHIQKLISVAEKISTLLAQHTRLTELMPELILIKKITTYEKRSTLTPISKMHRFLNLLHSKTFSGQSSYYFSWQGKIIETYSIYEEIKTDFVQLWEILGAIDAQLCTYKLLTSNHNQFCLPTWISSQEPILHITNYWHPTLTSQKAIKNSIQLGNNNQPHNIIVTGANAGGKTTALTAIMIAQILAQSIGVAPASSFFATPFARLHTYLDITTNLEAHESLFVAQANRAEKLYQSISSCKTDEKTLTILDEIFTGTRADFAENASFKFAQTLGEMPHSICILATHFPKLTQLESLNLYVNYHAANATINEDETLSYPYKIIPGISTQNIAEYILKRKGLLKS